MNMYSILIVTNIVLCFVSVVVGVTRGDSAFTFASIVGFFGWTAALILSTQTSNK